LILPGTRIRLDSFANVAKYSDPLAFISMHHKGRADDTLKCTVAKFSRAQADRDRWVSISRQVDIVTRKELEGWPMLSGLS
jgi:hypothetical protein